MKRVWLFWLVVFLIAVVIAVCYVQYKEHHAVKPNAKIEAPSTSGPGVYYHDGKVLLPNPVLSPGVVRPDTTEDEVCNTTTPQFRHTSKEMKQQVYATYGVIPHEGICADAIRTTRKGKQVTESCEVDHIISLELGGADDVRNMFIQPYNPPDGVPGAHAKDVVENWLHHQVCVTHTMSLQEAQHEISTDWYQVYLNNHLDTSQ